MDALEKMIGQSRIKRLLSAEIGTAFLGHGTLANILLHGGPGLGKSSIARAVAQTCGYEMKEWVVGSDWSAQRIENELFSLPTTGYAANGMPTGKDTPTYLLFLDEVHNLKMSTAEALYEPMMTGHVLANGSKHWLPKIVVCAATTKISALPAAFKSRFGLQLRVDPYSLDDLCAIIAGSFPSMPKHIIAGVSLRCKGIPRVALQQAQRVQNFGGLAWYDAAGIDENGLDQTDLRYLEILGNSRRPVSLSTLAAMLGEPVSTITEIVEPYLLSKGLVEITPKGRSLVASGRGERGC